MNRTAAAVGLLLAAALPLTACAPAAGGGSADPAPDPIEETTAPDPQPAGDVDENGLPTGSVVGLLASVPSTSADHWVAYFGDIDAISEANDRPRPTPGDVDGLLAWLSPADAVVPVYLPEQLGGRAPAQHDEYAAELGFGLWDAEQFAGLEAAPDAFSVLRGPIDPDAIEAVLGEPSTAYWSVGPDNDYELDPAGATAARPLGRGLRLGMIDDDMLLLSLSTPRIHSAMQGEGSGLIRELDMTVYAAVGLAEADAISGALVGGPFPGGTDALPGGFSAVGIGHDADGLITLSYACYDEDAAAANVPAIEELIASGTTQQGSAYAEHFTLQSVEADGYTVTATIELTDPAKAMVPFTMLMSGESLFTTNAD